MSSGIAVVCHSCKEYEHLIIISAGTPSFGIGSTDTAGREHAARFIDLHLGHDLRIESEDDADSYEGYRDLYLERMRAGDTGA